MTAAARSATEEVLPVPCGDALLTGILHLPPSTAPSRSTALVIVVGGPQYRVGSHRQFVLLARAAAAAGYAVLRFDTRGMGDSDGQHPGFEQLSADLAAAVDALVARLPGISSVALWGLCDGASAALLYVDERRDPRVRGLCLANPWVRSTQTQARVTLRHYYTQRILQPEFWRKLLRGRIGREALREFQSNRLAARSGSTAAVTAPFHERMLRGLVNFEGPVMVLLSEHDYTAREFSERTQTDARWQAALRRPRVHLRDLPGADHTFSDAGAQHRAEAETLRWLDSWAVSA